MQMKMVAASIFIYGQLLMSGCAADVKPRDICVASKTVQHGVTVLVVGVYETDGQSSSSYQGRSCDNAVVPYFTNPIRDSSYAEGYEEFFDAVMRDIFDHKYNKYELIGKGYFVMRPDRKLAFVFTEIMGYRRLP